MKPSPRSGSGGGQGNEDARAGARSAVRPGRSEIMAAESPANRNHWAREDVRRRGGVGRNRLGGSARIGIRVPWAERRRGRRRRAAFDRSRTADGGRGPHSGSEVSTAGNVVRSQIGYFPTYRALSVDDLATGACGVRGTIFGMSGATLRERAESLLEMAGLCRAVRSKMGGFSRGMKQRLGVAQALINAPSVCCSMSRRARSTRLADA